jgi:hypothetical protein
MDRARWTLSLPEDKFVELNIVAKASDNTIRRTLKNPQTALEAAIRHSGAGFVAAMEDVLEVYHRPP